ncbi:MAG: beta-glucosidase-like glycosyl hydrolase, partial [Segetibacter sp.]|nr:beta-glucosidase-like glycosyl hydrolase [Segetibacter sp.]
GCAKHFPGHGDVDVDSHYDLPVINKTRGQLDSLELYPFRQVLGQGVGSVMIAHLYIPSIDTAANQATSLSYKNVTGLLRKELNYDGLTFTDALEMKGVTKFYPAGEASVQSLIAGNDILCLPGDVPGSIKKILQAIKKNKLTWDDIDARVKKVLLAKYSLGLSEMSPVVLNTLTADLNTQTGEINNLLARNSITLLRNNENLLPLKSTRVAYLAVGTDKPSAFSVRLKSDYNADIINFSSKDSARVNEVLSTLKNKYDVVVIGLHNYSRRPSNNFGLSKGAIQLINHVQEQMPAITFVFGNPYAIKNIANSKTLIACYEDEPANHVAAADLLQGKLSPKGKLPVTVSENLPFGTGITTNFYFTEVAPEAVGLKSTVLSKIDSIANNAITSGATPGCVVLVAKDGQIAFHKSYGYTNYDSLEAVNKETIYDLASVTKISATTISVMKLYEEGKLDIYKTLGDYLPWVKGTDKEGLTIQNVLLHQAGLVSFIPFYKEAIQPNGNPKPEVFSAFPTDGYKVPVAQDIYMRNDWIDTMFQRILNSKLEAQNKYIYSDNDFIFLGKVVEAITGQPLQDYVRETFYKPLNMTTTAFLPTQHFPINAIAPSEQEKQFRQQLLRGTVHDPGAAMFGGVAGHAGLFSNAYDLAQVYQLLLNGGELNGIRLLKKETIDFFTAYSSNISRRGLGYDKPEKDNATRKDPYPTPSASPATFGHTGYTGTCVWADPASNLLYIFLSNRVTPEGGENTKLIRMNVRGNIHETIYEALKAASQPAFNNAGGK